MSAQAGGVLVELASIVKEEWYLLSMSMLAWVIPHILLQYVVPYFHPAVYDSLGLADAAKGRKVSRGRLAADARTKIICTLQAIYFSAVCLYGLLAPESHALVEDHYGSTPVTRHLTALAASFFVWDLVVCALDGESVAYFFHGAACLFVFLAGLRPFQQYMCLVVLLFESSTPFLHLRKFLIQTQRGDGLAYTVVSVLFALFFFVSRIAVGLPASYAWWKRMLALLASGDAHNEVVVYLYLACNLLLCGLNLWWMLQIVRLALASTNVQHGKHRKEE